MADRLNTYRAKRDFSKTAEPEGGAPTSGSHASFVVQKHAARALHYDFRLEVEGTMPSWAVPKGPSYDPKVKRLAVHVEDHPLDYRDFEGTIQHGEYGGGAVIVWDNGTYRNITEDKGASVPMSDAIAGGHFSVWLQGSKLNGGWSLTRTSKEGERQETWIMVKRKDEFANPDFDVTEAEPRSVKSDRRVEDLREPDSAAPASAPAKWVPPMLAELAKSSPSDPADWVYERKFDGLRAIAVRNGDRVELWSRTQQSYTKRFAEIVAALGNLPVDSFTLDGEIVAFEGDRTSFELLQRPGSTAQPVYEIFDVLHLLGNDTTSLPLADRQRLMAELIQQSDVLQAVSSFRGDPDELLKQACRDGWEGLIAKRPEAPYRSGRSHDWRKLKCTASQELVIGGWTDPQGNRQHFGAILVGHYDDTGQLRYAGKVGTGFDEATLKDLHLQLSQRSRPDSPFVDTPRMKDAHWVEPELVANIAFTEWTADGKLRHPRYQGLRSDKPATEVRRERPAGRP